ncbi:MAG: Ku protein [Actinomycetota bacterium]|nr:Ku protein [Actinomycetota bacterium]MDQ3449855.1 Ku protein [Actinomycetota bacterium]
MARAIWTGYLSFGLVVLPVGLFSAIEQRDMRFNQFERETGKRVKYKRVAEDTDREVPYEKIVKGLETASGDYVMLTPQELASVEPGKSKTIEIGDFVSLDEIDPIYFEKSYYLAPKDKDAGKPYALLLQAMQDAERVGIAMFVMRGRQYLAAIRPSDDVLVLETLYYADEVRDPKTSLDRLPEQVDLSSREIGVAKSLIEQMTVPWEPDRYKDAYREAVLDLAKAKEDGKEVTIAPVKKEDTKVVDLTAALERSIAAAKEKRAGAKAEPEPVATTSTAAGKGTGPGAEELADMSREDLYARAQKLKIPGRSKMSRDDLADAVADAESETRAAS